MISIVMHAKTILSSKGQLIIPKFLRSKLGLHLGSEIMIELKENDTLELRPMRKDIKSFFGLGKNKTKTKIMSIEDMDNAIGKAVTDNDRH
jgi:AbrB family looped-hinge helix DNA binding protein